MEDASRGRDEGPHANQNRVVDDAWNVSLAHSELQSILEFLSSDLLEGRAPGTRGSALAQAYLKSLFKLWDIKPGVPGDYRQPFELNGFTTRALSIAIGGEPLAFEKEIVGTVVTQEKTSRFEADLVFVGFGIATDLWKWDDFKDANVKGKIILARVNDPGLYRPDVFEGKVLTYFGRWTYHIEEAIRRGAAGILLIHTDETAGYSWNVTLNSWSAEKVLLGSQIENGLKLRAWIKEESLRRVLKAKGISLDKLYEASLDRDFRPIALDLKVRVQSEVDARKFRAENVVGVIPGAVSKTIVLSAHFDHLGVGKEEKGDAIYNGAIDNASAVASMMLAARILKQHQSDLYYSVALLACDAEEGGLLGSTYYVERAERQDIVANINFESTPVWDSAASLMGIGARFSTFEELIQEVAKDEGLATSEFSLVDQGLFYRSDQFPFALKKIPAVWISAGEDDASLGRKYTAFWKGDYHTVRDEFDPAWKLESMEQTIRAAVRLVRIMSERRLEPQWKRPLPFPQD